MTKAISFTDAMAGFTKLAVPDSLYVHRPLANAARLHAWATSAGIPNLVPPQEMHVTQVYSRDPVQLEPRDDTVQAVGGRRGLSVLGDKGAVVLHFHNDLLQARHQQAMAAGASHDWPQYLTHVTLSYDGGGADLGAIEPPTFPLEFGPEVHAPINDGWAEEKGLRKMIAKLFAKSFDPSEARDGDGKWTDGGGGSPSARSSSTHERAEAARRGMGPDLGESIDEDTAWERMAAGLQETHAAGVHAEGPAAARDTKQVWIKNSPLKTIDEVYAGAEANKATLDQAGAQIAEATGTEYRSPGIKKLPRVLEKTLVEKMAAGRPAAGVTDIVRATFVAQSPADADAVVHRLAGHFPVTDEGYKFTQVGYFDRAVNVRFSNGQIGEVLIAPPELVQAKGRAGGGHELYKQWRALAADDPKAHDLAQAQRDIYGAARAKLSPQWKAVLGSGGAAEA